VWSQARSPVPNAHSSARIDANRCDPTGGAERQRLRTKTLKPTTPNADAPATAQRAVKVDGDSSNHSPKPYNLEGFNFFRPVLPASSSTTGAGEGLGVGLAASPGLAAGLGAGATGRGSGFGAVTGFGLSVGAAIVGRGFGVVTGFGVSGNPGVTGAAVAAAVVAAAVVMFAASSYKSPVHTVPLESSGHDGWSSATKGTQFSHVGQSSEGGISPSEPCFEGHQQQPMHFPCGSPLLPLASTPDMSKTSFLNIVRCCRAREKKQRGANSIH
jgi:hypothetical protein